MTWTSPRAVAAAFGAACATLTVRVYLMVITEEQLHAVQETLSDELPDADSVHVDVNEPNLAKFVVLVGEQQRYRLAVTHDFFTVYQTPNAVIAELETRFVARELRDNPERWLLLGRNGPPVFVAGIHLG